jgi:hypothetical protein
MGKERGEETYVETREGAGKRGRAGVNWEGSEEVGEGMEEESIAPGDRTTSLELGEGREQ